MNCLIAQKILMKHLKNYTVSETCMIASILMCVITLQVSWLYSILMDLGLPLATMLLRNKTISKHRIKTSLYSASESV